MTIRYSFGGDEHIFVEIDEKMSLDAFFQSLSMTNEVRDRGIEGITEICPANASFQIKFNPDVITPNEVLAILKGIESEAEHADNRIETRIVEVPVFYQDPWTYETQMRFRERHQDPSGTDLEYAARVNGYESVDRFIEAHHGSPWFVTMVGFVAGLPFMYQMVEQDKQIQVPKYLRPRTETPKLTVGYGGCFSCIYSVKGAGGYQMFGVTPMPIYDPTQEIKYLKDFMVFFKPGDIVKFTPVDRATYDQIVADVDAGQFEPVIKPVTFSLDEFKKDTDDYNRKLMEVINVD